MSRNYSVRFLALTMAAALSMGSAMLSGCVNRPIEKPKVNQQKEVPHYFPQSVEKDIDILFVIDNSNSMAQEQTNLSAQFPKFVDALRSAALGKDGSGKTCTATNQLGCKIPNVRIGVVSSDLGAGNYQLPSCEVNGGDGGKLQTTAMKAGCIPPSNAWISYNEGVTNIKSSTKDSITQVKEAFQCIAELGTGGCGFEYTIEAARRALDPNLNVNKGFIRKDAYLAIVFITDEDDCSAKKTNLFDPQQTSVSDPLGPLTSFRCFEFGLQCECAGGSKCSRTAVGPRKNCKPAFDWLYKVDDYAKFFKGLKPQGRVIMFAIAGPTNKVEVGLEGQNPILRPSCQTSIGKAVPALRIKALVDTFGKKGYFNVGTDTTLTQSKDVNICHMDYSPALRLLGKVIVATLGGQCIAAPPLSENGGSVCNKGDLLGTKKDNTPVKCANSCLDKAECVVTLVENQGETNEKRTLVPKCEAAKFTTPGNKDCGAKCPCWRITASKDCTAALHGSPYGLEVLRKGEAPKGQVAEVKCATSPYKWNTAAFAAAAETNQCQ